MVQEADSMREEDMRKKDTVQGKNDAETLSFQVEKQLSELKDKMTTAEADELKDKMTDLRAYMATEDVDLDELKKRTTELQEKSWKITQQAYQQGSSEGSEETKTEEKEGKKEEKEKK